MTDSKLNASRATRSAWLKERASYQLPTAILPPATIPALLPGNLLPVAQQGKVLPVSIPDPGFVTLPGEEITLHWGSSATAPYPVTGSESWPITLDIPANFFVNHGEYEFVWKYKTLSTETHESTPVTIRVDLRAPNLGQPYHALEFVPEVVNNGVTRGYLDANNGVPLTITGLWSDVEEDDIIHVYWAHELIPTPPNPTISYPVTSTDITNDRVTVLIPKDHIEQLPEGYAGAVYFLQDRAGNLGAASLVASTWVYLNPLPTGLQPVRVPLAGEPSPLIDLDDLRAGVEAVIDAYANALPQDLIQVKWGTVNLTEEPLGNGDFPRIIRIPTATITTVGNNPALAVNYTLKRGTHFTDSPTEITLEVNIQAPGPDNPDPTKPNPNLTLLVARGASGAAENTIVPDDNTGPVKVTIDAYTPINAGEIINVYWGDMNAAAAFKTLTQDELDLNPSEFVIDVPWDKVAALGNNPATNVRYGLSNSVNETFSAATIVSVRVTGVGGPGGLDNAEYPDKNPAGWLVGDAVINGVKVHIPPYEGIRRDDKINAVWETNDQYNGSGSAVGPGWSSGEIPVTDDHIINGITVTVPFADVIDVLITKVGAGKLEYTVTDVDGYTGTSSGVYVPIDFR